MSPVHLWTATAELELWDGGASAAFGDMEKKDYSYVCWELWRWLAVNGLGRMWP